MTDTRPLHLIGSNIRCTVPAHLTAALVSLFAQVGPMHTELVNRPACRLCEGFGYMRNATRRMGRAVCAACHGDGWAR